MFINNCDLSGIYLLFLVIVSPSTLVKGRRNKTHKVLVCQEIELPTLPVFVPVRDDGSLAFYRLPGSDPVPNVPVCKDPLPDIRILFTIPHLNYSTILTLPTRRTTTPSSIFANNQPIGTNLGNAYFPVVNNANSGGSQNGLNNLNGGLPFLGNLMNLGLDSLNESRNAVASVSGNIKVSVVQSSNNHATGNLTADVGFNITQNFNIGPKQPSGNAGATLSDQSTTMNVTDWPTPSSPTNLSVIPLSPGFPSTTASDSPATTISGNLTSVPPYSVTNDQTTTIANPWTTTNTNLTITPSTSLPPTSPIKRCPERTTDLSLLRAPMQNGIVCGYFLDLSNKTVKNFCDDVSHTWDVFHATVPFMQTCCAAWILILRCDQITGPSPADATTPPFTDFFSWNTNTTSTSTTTATTTTHEYNIYEDLNNWNSAIEHEDNIVQVKIPEDDTYVPPVPMRKYYAKPVNVFDSSNVGGTDHTFESEYSPQYHSDDVSPHSDYVHDDNDIDQPPSRFDSYHDADDNQQIYDRDPSQWSRVKRPDSLLSFGDDSYPAYSSPSAMPVNPEQMFPPNPVWKPSTWYRP